MKIKRGFSKKGYLQISFAWLFALLVGAVILFIAIFAVTKIIKTGEKEIGAETAKEISVLMQPLETSFQEGTTSYMILPSETKIYNKCNNFGNFGRQLIQVSQKSFGKFTETDIDVGFSNKYIFSEAEVEGKKFYLFSKPFDYPFKVSDLIFLSSASKQYCFLDAPRNVEDDIGGNFQENLKTKDCSETDIKICFRGIGGSGGSDCDMKVIYDKEYDKEAKGYVEKQGVKLYFVGDALMYGAIFADKDIYECQVKRLMQRTEQLCSLYKDKAFIVAQKDCNTNLESELILLNNLAKSLSKSVDLNSITYVVEDIQEKHEDALCKLW